MMNDDVGPCHDISLFTYESAVMNMLKVAGEIFELTKCMKIVTSVLTWVGNKFLPGKSHWQLKYVDTARLYVFRNDGASAEESSILYACRSNLRAWGVR